VLRTHFDMLERAASTNTDNEQQREEKTWN
jgi:hypothetical protein